MHLKLYILIYPTSFYVLDVIFYILFCIIVVVHSLSCVQLFETPWSMPEACQASLSFTYLEFAQTHVHWVSDAVQPQLPSSPALYLSQHRDLFSSELALCIRWPRYWSFSISPSNEYSALISFRIDWFDFLAVQGTLKSLLQYHILKASVLWHSAAFMVQISHPYMTTGKTKLWQYRSLLEVRSLGSNF